MWINECAYCKRQQHTTIVWNITAVQKTLLVLKRCQEKIFSLLHLFCTVPTVSGTRSSTVCYYVSFTSVVACFCLLLGFSQFRDSGSQITQGIGPTGLVYNPPLDKTYFVCWELTDSSKVGVPDLNASWMRSTFFLKNCWHPLLKRCFGQEEEAQGQDHPPKHLGALQWKCFSFSCFDIIAVLLCVFKWGMWRVRRGREPWERSEAGGVIGNERHLRHSPVSSPTEELRKE